MFRYFFNRNKARVMPTLSRDDQLVIITTISVPKQPRTSFTDAATVHVDSIFPSSSDDTCFMAACQLFPSFNSISAPGHLVLTQFSKSDGSSPNTSSGINTSLVSMVNTHSFEVPLFRFADPVQNSKSNLRFSFLRKKIETLR